MSLTLDKLRPDGGDMPVTAPNLSTFIELRKQAKLIQGIGEPMMLFWRDLGCDATNSDLLAYGCGVEETDKQGRDL